MKYFFKNIKLVTEYGIEWDGAIVTEDDRIVACGSARDIEAPADAEVIGGQGLYAGPGLVDIHNHGGGSYDFPIDPYHATEYFLTRGTTTVCSTTYMTMTKEEFLEAIKRGKEVIENGGVVGEALAGFYMEGPYMDPRYGSNADLCAWKGRTNPADYKEVVDAAGTYAKVWACDPDREGIEDFMRYAKQVNPDVMISCGHCEAQPVSVRRLKRLGMGLQTHCTNATGIQEHPNACEGIKGVGPNEADWLDDDMYAEMISDYYGIHVHDDMQKLIIKIKGVDRTVLITDSGVSEAPNPPDKAYIDDLIFNERGQLSGSKITLNRACRNVMHHTRVGICECFLMAARNPARVIAMDDQIGTIEPGKKADIILVTDDFTVKKIMKNGKFVPVAEEQ